MHNSTKLPFIVAKYLIHSILYIKTVRPWLLFSFGTFDSFLAVLVRNQVYVAYCSAETAHKPVLTSSEKQKTGNKSLLS